MICAILMAKLCKLPNVPLTRFENPESIESKLFPWIFFLLKKLPSKNWLLLGVSQSSIFLLKPFAENILNDLQKKGRKMIFLTSTSSRISLQIDWFRLGQPIINILHISRDYFFQSRLWHNKLKKFDT